MLRSFTPFIAMIAVVIIGTDRRIVRTFRDTRATSPESGIPLTPRNPIWRWRLRRLVGRGAVVHVDPDRWYLDETGWKAYRSWRRRRVVTVLAILIPLVALYAWLDSTGRI